MSKRRLLSEDNDYKLFEGPEAGLLVQQFVDPTPTPIPSLSDMRGSPGVGALANRISGFLMGHLQNTGIMTHYLHTLNMQEQMVKHLSMLPVCAVMHNVAYGDFASRCGMPPGTIPPRPIIEFYAKNRDGSIQLVSEDAINAFGWAHHQDMDDMMILSSRINSFLAGFFVNAGMRVARVRLSFGHLVGDFDDSRLIVGGCLTPSYCELQDINTQDLYDLTIGPARAKIYREVARRLGLLGRSEIVDFDAVRGARHKPHSIV
ncbi:MAG: phosphoribosylaminoimidazolesuccinocarboxamide synthase [Pseudomonadota bacterium]